MSGGGKGGGDVEQTTTNEPWGPLQPYLAGGNRVGATQAGSPPVQGLYDLSYQQAMRPLGQAYTFGTLSRRARNALDAATRSPSDLEKASRNEFRNTIEGDYLYGGPGFDAAYQAGARQVIPQVSSMFSGGGRLNSGLAQAAMTQGLGDVFAGLYDNERARQLAAANQYPAMQQAQLQRLSVPVSLGESADALRRQRAMEPQQRLNWLGQQLGAVATPSSSTLSSPSQSSTLGNVLGAGYLGTGILNNLGLSSGLGLFGGGSAATGAGALASLMGGGGSLASMGLPASAAGASTFLSNPAWLALL